MPNPCHACGVAPGGVHRLSCSVAPGAAYLPDPERTIPVQCNQGHDHLTHEERYACEENAQKPDPKPEGNGCEKCGGSGLMTPAPGRGVEIACGYCSDPKPGPSDAARVLYCETVPCAGCPACKPGPSEAALAAADALAPVTDTRATSARARIAKSHDAFASQRVEKAVAEARAEERKRGDAWEAVAVGQKAKIAAAERVMEAVNVPLDEIQIAAGNAERSVPDELRPYLQIVTQQVEAIRQALRDYKGSEDGK